MKSLTDEQVEKEIERLRNTREVKLSQLEQRVKYRRRQALYTLRWQEKHGKELLESGIDEDVLLSMDKEFDNE